MERKQVHDELSAKTKSRNECGLKALEYTRLGDEIFRTKYNNTFSDEVDLEMDGYWDKADQQTAEKVKLDAEIEVLLKRLVDLTPDEFLRDYESCGTVGHSYKKLVKIKFFDGEEKVGYIYPWEGDYCGPPYYFTNYEHDTLYINMGEFIESVELA